MNKRFEFIRMFVWRWHVSLHHTVTVHMELINRDVGKSARVQGKFVSGGRGGGRMTDTRQVVGQQASRH